jgi:hypothetical protein
MHFVWTKHINESLEWTKGRINSSSLCHVYSFGKVQQHHGGGQDLVLALNFNYFVEKLVKICVVVSTILKKLQMKLHETMIYSSVRQLGFRVWRKKGDWRVLEKRCWWEFWWVRKNESLWGGEYCEATNFYMYTFIYIIL